MNKVAIFGKPGSGKSTLALKLGSALGIPALLLDRIQYNDNGDPSDPDEFSASHQAWIEGAEWIIDGLGPRPLFQARLQAADTWVYVDIPYWRSYWWVTKRCLLSPFMPISGWPEKASVLRGTWLSYKTLRLCPTFWNDAFIQRLRDTQGARTLIVLRTQQEVKDFLSKVGAS